MVFGIYLRRCLQARLPTPNSPLQSHLEMASPFISFKKRCSSSIPLLSIRWTQPGSCNRAEHPAVTPAFPSSRAAQTQTHPSRETGTGSPRPGHCQAHFIPTADRAKLRVIGEGSTVGQSAQREPCWECCRERRSAASQGASLLELLVGELPATQLLRGSLPPFPRDSRQMRWPRGARDLQESAERNA